MKYLLILFTILVVACSPEKRIHRIALKHGLLHTDTISIIDTVKIEAVRADTTFFWSQLTDTLILTKDRLKVTVIKNGDTVRVSGECDSIFVYKEIKVPYEKIVIKTSFWDKYGDILMVILFLLVLIFGYLKFSK